MIIATHAIVGGAIAGALNSNPILSFVAGVASHYFLDYLPHWDYDLPSAEVDEANPLANKFTAGPAYRRDLIKVGTDLAIGLALAVFFFVDWQSPMSIINILTGAIGGIFPDLAQFLYMKLGIEPFATMQKWHFFFHTKSKLKEKPLLGISLQLVVIIIALLVGDWRFFSWW